jgi:hypothetical protein
MLLGGRLLPELADNDQARTFAHNLGQFVGGFIGFGIGGLPALLFHFHRKREKSANCLTKN